MKHIHFKSIDSTNGYLKANHHLLKHFTYVSTQEQSAGYGQKKAPWISTKESATFSLLLKKNIPAHMAPLMPLLTAVALHKVLSHYHQNLTIKWPNDIMANHQKLAGILCESVISGNLIEALIIGVGLNLNQTSFEQRITKDATSLYMLTGHQYMIKAIIKKCLTAIKKEIKLYLKGSLDYIDYLNHYHMLKDLTLDVLVHQKVITGLAKNITFKGHLELITDDGFMELTTGSIQTIHPK